MKKYSPCLLIAFLFVVSCHTSYQAESVQYSHYKIQQHDTKTSSLGSIIKPYGDSINKSMQVMIGNNETTLEKKRQGNLLGYFMTDAYLEMARKKINPAVDAAFQNSGGIRLPDLPAGPVMQGKIFELMPFDNMMVELKMKGSLLKQYLDSLAAGEGIIQSGMTMHIMNKTVQRVMIGTKPLDPDAVYTIVHSEYVVNNSNQLKNLDRTIHRYLLRDAIIDYVKHLDSQGKQIKVINTERISYVN